MSCPDCTRAKVNPKTSRFTADCFECRARMLAHGPQFFEATQAEALTPAYRSALQAAFGQEWKAGHEEVKKWAQRISG